MTGKGNENIVFVTPNGVVRHPVGSVKINGLDLCRTEGETRIKKPHW